LKKKFNAKFEEEHIEKAVKRIANENIIIEEFKTIQKKERKKKEVIEIKNTLESNNENSSSNSIVF